MIIVCGWCMKILGNKEPLTDQRVSHGICPECQEKILSNASKGSGDKESKIYYKEEKDKETKTTPST